MLQKYIPQMYPLGPPETPWDPLGLTGPPWGALQTIGQVQEVSGCR